MAVQRHLLLLLLLLLQTLLLWGLTSAAFDIRGCDQPLGMESGYILDSAITASSSYVPNVGPQNGRLRVEKAGGAWCPKQQVEKGIREYLQIDLGQIHAITGIQTQGRYDHGRGQEYMEEYSVEYWRPGFEKWREYSRWDGKQIISGNTDTETVVSHRLIPAIFASIIRILPYSVHRRTVCLRVEVKGCEAEDGIVSYQIPKDPSAGLDFSDTSYDGDKSGEVLKGGLGRLVDGEFGGDNFRLDIGYGKGNGWVGWKRSTFPKGFIEIIFEFDELRNFSQVQLFTNNLFSKDVEVFSKAKVSFSIGGRFYNKKPVIYTYMPDHMIEVARNVTIHLHGRIGRFVKMHLYFANKWIMISEITFRSDLAYDANVTEEAVSEHRDEEEQLVKFGGIDMSLNSLEAISAENEDQSYVEAIIGILTAMVLLLLVVFITILILSRRQKLQTSPTLFRNPFGVTINMKDLLMNLTPSANHSINVSDLHTPVSVGPPPSDFEEYKSPLVSYSGPNYATLIPSQDDSQSDVLQPSFLPDEKSAKTPPDSPSLTTTSFSPSYTSLCGADNNVIFRSADTTATLQKSALHSSDSGSGGLLRTLYGSTNLQNGRINGTVGRQRSKMYHTAPRDKHRIPPPVVSWNVAPSMGQTYKCKEAELVPIPRSCLKIREQLGVCHSGEVFICETEGLEEIVPGCGKVVAVRTGSRDLNHTISGAIATNSLREVRFLASLSDPCLAMILGVCTSEQPPWVVFEHYDLGDLVQYLKYRSASPLVSNSTSAFGSVQLLSYGCLLYMCTQIASAVKYLESKNVVHKDIAARNCLVGTNYSIKLADIAVCSPLYKADYVELGGRQHAAPIRWLPWESVLMDRYTCSSSVWSLAVTIWEVLNLARERPFQYMTNEQVIRAAEHMYYGGELEVVLPKPSICREELYELLNQCWLRDEMARPTAKDIHCFLKVHNAGYDPDIH